MSIDFTPDADVAALADETARFVRDEVIPVEIRCGGSVHDAPESARMKLQQSARAAGVFAPQVPVEFGGRALDMRGQAIVFEQAGYSLLGPLAMNIAAPDEGNMHLLAEVATAEQRDRFLRPLAAGEIRSAFAMTEPSPGAGSDPRALASVAVRAADGWHLTGHKWFISGARGASVFIVMARTSGAPGDTGGATMFLVPADAHGVEIIRDIPTMDASLIGGHSEIRFRDVVVSPDSVLGEVDGGFLYAQVRLAPARLTHCMRWLGIARRAQDLALDRAADRSVFGSRLADLGMVQNHLAESEIDIETSRALILRCAHEIDVSGMQAGRLSSIAKVSVSEAVWRVVDRAVQICGALGVSEDLLLSRYLREVRAFRIYDGPSETHRWSVAKAAIRYRARGVAETNR